MVPRDKINYVVSFMGYAPADDPKIAIYVVVDRPNVADQDDAKFATRLVRSILTESLPYLGIFMTEEVTEEEQAELEMQQGYNPFQQGKQPDKPLSKKEGDSDGKGEKV